MVHLALEKGYSVAVMLGVAAAAVALAAWFYRSARQASVPARRWRMLLLLRLLAILLVVLLLFRPVLSFERDAVQRRALILLVDTSASMTTADDASGASRFEQARGRVLDWWGKLSKDFDLHLVEFSDQASPLQRPADLALRQPPGQATSLTRALTAASQKVARRDIEAAILLSDGVHNAAGDPVQTARKLGLVVHTVGVGNSLRDSPSYRDVQMTGMDCPDQLPVNNRAKVTAFVDAVGFAGRVVKAVLEEDGVPVAEAELVLDGAEGTQEIAFQFVPKVKGRHTYTARVPAAPGEKIDQNNQRSAAARVVDTRIRVLYLEGTLRAEYGALVDRFFSRDPDLEFSALVQTRKNVFLQRTNMEGLKLAGIPSDPDVLKRFDVFLLGDLDSSYLKPEQMGLLVKRVREGAGLMMMGGYHSLGPGGYEGTPLGEVLPVSPGPRDIGQVTDPFLPVLTPDGRQHAVFANIAKFFPSSAGKAEVDGLPPLEGCVKVGKARPGATVLAVCPAPAEEGGPMPVLAVQPVGAGRTAVFAGDTTRNWQQVLRGLDQESPFLRFWGQTVRWLAGRTEEVKAEAGVVASTDKAYYEPDAPVSIHASVRDKQGEAASQAKVSARVKGPGGEVALLTLAPVPGPAGQYGVPYQPKTPGSYEVLVDAKVGDATVQSEKVPFEVGRPNLEFDRLDLDEKMLSRIASATGGRYFHVSTADRLLEELDRTQQRRRLVLEQRLYWPPGFWLLFVAALTAEWGLRRRYQLR